MLCTTCPLCACHLSMHWTTYPLNTHDIWVCSAQHAPIRMSVEYAGPNMSANYSTCSKFLMFCNRTGKLCSLPRLASGTLSNQLCIERRPIQRVGAWVGGERGCWGGVQVPPFPRCSQQSLRVGVGKCVEKGVEKYIYRWLRRETSDGCMHLLRCSKYRYYSLEGQHEMNTFHKTILHAMQCSPFFYRHNKKIVLFSLIYCGCILDGAILNVI